MPLLEKIERLSLKATAKDTPEKDQVDGTKETPATGGTAPGAASTNIAPPSQEAPPSYEVNDSAEPAGPSPEELSAAFSNLQLPEVPGEIPSANECLAHLKLLTAFHGLKEDIGYNDGLFGLWNARCEMVEDKVAALARMREKRWVLYIARAVERFEEWWVNILCPMDNARRLQAKMMNDTNAELRDFTIRGRVMQWTTSMLPPIDVLMVWHAFMLNPRNYLEDCVRFGIANVWTTGLPWPAVNAAIDTSFNYNVPDLAKVTFAEKTGHNWSNVEDSLNKSIPCPRCSQQLEIPWTTVGMSEKPSPKELEELSGTGYGDRDFAFMCHKCGEEVNHDLIRVAKFRKDTENLIMKDWPLKGTIINPQTGAPNALAPAEADQNPVTFPNRLIGVELRSKIIELLNTRGKANPTMNDIKKMIEVAIKNKSIVKRVNHKSTFDTGILKRSERLSIRKMMSRYWDNSSLFAIELGGAVIRQSVFVDKMVSLDWLHSPAAQQTMNRLMTKYRRFIQIIAQYPLHTAVPTLDVDLGWHTHQLSPRPYYVFTVRQCKKFIDHDDKIAEDALEKSFEWTSKTYEKLWNEVYSECTCWYCEAIRSKHISNSGKIFGTSKHEKISNTFHASGAAQLCPPSNSAHISSHNAVRAIDDPIGASVYERLRVARQLDLDRSYEKAQKRAKARGETLPPRDQYYYAAWGYPYMMYGPFMAYPMMGGMYYAGDPCVMPVGVGMPGNCAAGACSGAVGAGGCGGPGGCGSGGCGAGAGGCGGGGGGGCGGGGGGGGCGGGGC
ncbi:hypothetical protein BGZ60DRAFT_428328 [Tricladium varicosporioides]|nr:hypothetical protein BGZ60DRAFT_428328 [Hymenoscyphus varicosporioides]